MNRITEYGKKIVFTSIKPKVISSDLKQYGDIYLPANDSHFQRWFKGGSIKYQTKQLAIAVQNTNKKGLFVDIGGHVGLMTKQALEMGFERFIAFEPNLISADCFCLNVKGNGLLHTKALASENKKGQLIQEDKANSGTMKINDSNNENAIDLYKFDDLVDEEEIDLMKIDVEGYELEVLQGAKRSILKAKPVILIEQSPNSNLTAVSFLKEEFGMNLIANVGKDYILKF